MRIPDEFFGIEGNALRQSEAEHCGERKQDGLAGRKNAKMTGQARGCKYQQTAANAKTQQRDADNQVGKVMPLDQRKQCHQQDFIGQYRRGYQGNGNPGLRGSIHAGTSGCR